MIKLFILFFSVSIFSHEVTLVTYQSESNPEEKGVLKIITDNEFRDLQGFKIEVTKNKKIIREKNFEIEVNDQDFSFVLYKKKGHEVITLNNVNATPTSGGEIKLSYLYNGALGLRKDLPLQIIRNGDEWGLFDQKENKVKHLKCKENSILGRVIGVKEIEVKTEKELEEAAGN